MYASDETRVLCSSRKAQYVTGGKVRGAAVEHKVDGDGDGWRCLWMREAGRWCAVKLVLCRCDPSLLAWLEPNNRWPRLNPDRTCGWLAGHMRTTDTESDRRHYRSEKRELGPAGTCCK